LLMAGLEDARCCLQDSEVGAIAELNPRQSSGRQASTLAKQAWSVLVGAATDLGKMRLLWERRNFVRCYERSPE
ncbi:MAG TPA: hypothetical protein IGS37_19855, partial [Synechococcales cyanobacterium M55_K2018_004]|nr:hypothetical protein [Synechococcales cyanobacterium M55_K2018_004]